MALRFKRIEFYIIDVLLSFGLLILDLVFWMLAVLEAILSLLHESGKESLLI